MKVNIIYFAAFLCLTHGKRDYIYHMADTSMPLNKHNPDEKVPKEKIIITNPHLYPFMASIQRSPGRQSFGYSATFIAEYWVLNHMELLKRLVSGTVTPKKMVVMSHAVSSNSKKARIHRVKKIIEEPETGMTLIKVNDGIYEYAQMVPPNYTFNEDIPLYVLTWSKNLKYLYEYTGLYYNSTLHDCQPFSALYFCTEPVQFTYNQSLSPIMNAQDELVGVLLDASGSTDDEEEFWSISYYGPIFKDIMRKN